MTQKPWNHGQFVWRELLVHDVEKAKGFYAQVLGWTFETSPMGGFDYTLVLAAGRQQGGIMPILPDMGATAPNWKSFVSVPDVDAAFARATASGGGVVLPPSDIPNVGRFAIVTDPAGVGLPLLHQSAGDGLPEVPPTGAFCWETLVAPDLAAAKAFYGAVVGWKPVPGPGGGDVDVFAAGGVQVADLQRSSAHMPPCWITYVAVDRLETVRDRVPGAGGKVLVPLIEIPEVGRIALVADPEGASLGLFEPQPR